MEREKNMTTGRPLRLIVTFAVPLMIGGIGQQLYTLVDSVVVGRGLGVAGLAAVGQRTGLTGCSYGASWAWPRDSPFPSPRSLARAIKYG